MNVIVVAAGASRRYGHANKLLARRAGTPLIATTLARVLAATRGPVVIVVGHQSRRLIAALARSTVASRRLRVVRNPRARDGLATSLGHGLRAAVRLDSAVAIHLADLPVFEAALVSRLRRALNHGALAARPLAGSRPGHPVILRRRILPADSQAADAGLRKALANLDAARFARPACAPRYAADIDTRQMMRNRN